MSHRNKRNRQHASRPDWNQDQGSFGATASHEQRDNWQSSNNQDWQSQVNADRGDQRRFSNYDPRDNNWSSSDRSFDSRASYDAGGRYGQGEYTPSDSYPGESGQGYNYNRQSYGSNQYGNQRDYGHDSGGRSGWGRQGGYGSEQRYGRESTTWNDYRGPYTGQKTSRQINDNWSDFDVQRDYSREQDQSRGSQYGQPRPGSGYSGGNDYNRQYNSGDAAGSGYQSRDWYGSNSGRSNQSWNQNAGRSYSTGGGQGGSMEPYESGQRSSQSSSGPSWNQGWSSNQWNQGSNAGVGNWYGGTGRARGNAPKSYKRGDQSIMEEVVETLMDEGIDCSGVDVQVKDGTVTLTGEVQHRTDKYRIEHIASQLSGVHDVDNQLKLCKCDGANKSASNCSTSEDTSSKLGSTNSYGSTTSSSTGIAGAAAKGTTEGASKKY